MERHVYEILIVGIEQIHPELQFGTYELESEHMNSKVNIFDGKKKNAILTSGFQDK